MKPMERVLTSLSFKEPDKVPLLQLFSFYGAKELGIGIKDYFSNPVNVVEAQCRMQKKYKNDCFNAFFYASVEHEAFGGQTRFIENGPPNTGFPVIQTLKDIENLKEPDIENCTVLQNVLQTIRLLFIESKGEIPIVGCVISPFSLPVMQMGFDRYLDLIIGQPEAFWKLMEVNKGFCKKWGNLQLEAGATAIGYFDPVSSPSIITRNMYKETGWAIAKEILQEIKGPTVTHFASGSVFPVIDDVIETQTNVIAASSFEDIGEIKKRAYLKLSVLGNLNGIEMCRWTKKDAGDAVRNIIRKAGNGGGLLISDTHGEIPYQVPEKVLLAISESVETYGLYPN